MPKKPDIKTPKTRKRCPKCCAPGETLPVSAFNRSASRGDGLDGHCRDCVHDRQTKMYDRDKANNRERHAAEDERVVREAADRARRMASDHDALKLEDFEAAGDNEYDVGVGNVPGQGHVSASASRQKRQEFNEAMGNNANALKGAGASAHRRKGDVLSAMPADSGTYIGKLAEQERRFGNRRLARSISLAQAQEALALQHMRLVAEQFFANKVTPTGYAKRVPTKAAKRTVVCLLSDLHLGSDLSSLDEPIPFGAVEEARRLEYIMRQVIDYKPQYRENSRLALLLNGDIIEGQLGHQLGAGSPLTEQKAIAWHLLSRFVGECARAFPGVDVYCQPGNHGRDKVRHPGRATWRKWDGHEWEIYYALQQMCSGLKNVTWSMPFRAVSAINLHGSILGLTHADTEVKIGHPDSAAKQNARELDRINSSRIFGTEFHAWAFGHYHTPRYHPGGIRTIYNGALVPPNGHARASGYIGEACGQFLWEATAGFPIGDVRFIEVGTSQDNDPLLGKILTPFRFPSE